MISRRLTTVLGARCGATTVSNHSASHSATVRRSGSGGSAPARAAASNWSRSARASARLAA